MSPDIDSFLREIKTLKDELFPEAKIEITYKRIDKISLRIITAPSSLLDIYVNTETGRYDFALIKKDKRIFGYDNLGGWHYHPYNNPETHIECNEPDIKHVFKEMARFLK